MTAPMSRHQFEARCWEALAAHGKRAYMGAVSRAENDRQFIDTLIRAADSYRGASITEAAADAYAARTDIGNQRRPQHYRVDGLGLTICGRDPQFLDLAVTSDLGDVTCGQCRKVSANLAATS